MLPRFINQLSAFWQRQRPTQRVILISVVVLMLIAIPVLVSWSSTTSYGVVFTDLSELEASKIVDQLTANSISYQLRGTGTILVPSDRVYEVRLMMAKAGLPSSGGVGYELFSGSTLGMTEFSQKVNYQRALEGELERTIGSIKAVAAVRVHVVSPEKVLFTEDQAATTASVTIQQASGQQLDAAQIRAIAFLVANSVEGLKPENVVVVDTDGNMLASGGDGSIAGAATQVDSRRAAEKGVAADIQKKVKLLLDTVLGPNSSVVQTSVTLNWSDKQVTTEAFNPTPVAVRSSQKLGETYTTNGDSTGGIPGASSNLPGATPGVSNTGDGNLVYARSEETNNYEISKTSSQEKIPPGSVQKISLSVLVDGVTDTQQLTTLQSAISAAAGIDQDRGDVISVQTLKFDRKYAEQQSADLAAAQRNSLIATIALVAGGVLIGVFLLWYVLRLLRNLRMASVDLWTPLLNQAPAGAVFPRQAQTSPAIETLTMPDFSPVTLPPPPILPRAESRVPGTTPEEEQMQRVVSRLADDNPASVAEIIQLWLNEDKQRGG